MTFGFFFNSNHLIHLREENKISQSELAEKIHCNRSQISRLENNKTRNPGIKIVSAIARAFGVPINDFKSGSAL